MSSKVCFKCGEIKTLSEFYKHNMMADGHLNKCKVCTKADVLKHRNDNIEKVRSYDRERGCRQSAEDLARYREANPKKYAAHKEVQRAVKSGALVPTSCVVCDSTEVHGHHCDYDRPLDVMWLCAKHHKLWHTEFGEGRNA